MGHTPAQYTFGSCRGTVHSQRQNTHLTQNLYRLGIFVSGRMACIGHPKDITSRFCGFLVSWLPGLVGWQLCSCLSLFPIVTSVVVVGVHPAQMLGVVGSRGPGPMSVSQDFVTCLIDSMQPFTTLYLCNATLNRFSALPLLSALFACSCSPYQCQQARRQRRGSWCQTWPPQPS